MRTLRLPVVDWTDTPADLNGLVRFAERPNLVSARVVSHFKRSLPKNTYTVITGNLETDLSWKLFVSYQKTQTRGPRETFELTCHGNYLCLSEKHKHADHKKLGNRPVMEIVLPKNTNTLSTRKLGIDLSWKLCRTEKYKHGDHRKLIIWLVMEIVSYQKTQTRGPQEPKKSSFTHSLLQAVILV
jgi:hypothetical protein